MDKKRFWSICPALFAQTPDSTQADLANLHKAIAQFYEGVAAKNADMVLEIIADSAMMMPNGSNIIKGKAAIAEVRRLFPFLMVLMAKKN